MAKCIEIASDVTLHEFPARISEVLALLHINAVVAAVIFLHTE